MVLGLLLTGVSSLLRDLLQERLEPVARAVHTLDQQVLFAFESGEIDAQAIVLIA